MTEIPDPSRIAACLHFCAELPTEFLQRRQAFCAPKTQDDPGVIVGRGTIVNEIKHIYAGVVAVVNRRME